MKAFLFLGHSGFAVRTDSGSMVFDYWKDEPSAAAGGQDAVDPQAFLGGEAAVFVSHAHGDHFSPEIFAWRDRYPSLRYVVSSDIRTTQAAVRMGPGETSVHGPFTVRTLRSTDEGVAFLVQCGDTVVYHAGDLNWWDWEEDTPAGRDTMKRGYLEQIEQLRDIRIDLAFVAVDPRLGNSYALGLDALMRTAQVGHVVPMHFWGDYSVFDRLEQDPLTVPYRTRIIRLTHRGQREAF